MGEKVGRKEEEEQKLTLELLTIKTSTLNPYRDPAGQA